MREKERLKKKRETEKSVCTSSFVYIFQKSPVKDKMVRNRAGRQEPHRSSAAQNSKASRNFFFLTWNGSCICMSSLHSSV